MFFKNARIFQITGTLPHETLELSLQEIPARECGSLEQTVSGWASPTSTVGGTLVHRQLKIDMLRLVTHTKVMPTAVINKKTAERVSEIEQREARIVRKREQQQIKDDVILDMLPRAFQKPRDTYGYIDYSEKLLIINAASNTEALDFIAALRKVLGKCPVMPLTTTASPSAVMTGWLTDPPTPGGIDLEDEAVLALPAEGDKATLKHHDMESDEVAAHIEAGKAVDKLRVCWMDKISATIESDLALKRIKFSDIVAEQVADIEGNDNASRFDADLSIMTAELGECISYLIKVFGGIQRAENA